MGMLSIVRFTIQEAFHRWILFVMVCLNLLLIIAFAFLLNDIYPSISAGSSTSVSTQLRMLEFNVEISGLITWLVYLLSGVLTIILTIGMTSGEIESGTIAMIITKPLRRMEIIFGKWLGYGLIVCIYTAMLFCSFLGIVYWITGYWPQQAFQTLGTLELSPLVLLALTTLGSACVPTLINGAIVIFLFIGAPLASFIQLLVTATGTKSQNIATIINLIIPTDALWRGATFYLLPPATLQLLSGQNTSSISGIFIALQPIAPGLLIWAIIYCLVLPVIGAIRFQRRDL